MHSLHRRAVLAPFAALALILVGAGCADSGASPAVNGTAAGLGAYPGYGAPTGIQVTGLGTVAAEADRVELTLGVEAFADTVAEAHATAASALDRVISALTDSGVDADDLQTTRFDIRPEYVWEEVSRDGVRRSERRLVGYTVTNTLQARIHDLESVGETIDAAVQAGGDVTRVDGIRFTVQDGSPQEEEALLLATRDAMAKARLLAEETGVTLGKLTAISVVSAPRFANQEFLLREARAMDSAAVSTPILPGDVDVTVQVHAVFAIE